MTEIVKTMVTEPIKRRVRVTAEYEVDITIMPSVFGPMTLSEYIAEFDRTIVPVGSIDDVAEFAARTAVLYGSGIEDGLGSLNVTDDADVKYDIVYEDAETEIIEDAKS